MDKLSFFKENFKKGNLIVSFEENREHWGVYELLEDYDEGYRWVDVQRYYLRGEFDPLFTGFNISNRLSENSGTYEYVVIKGFYYD